MAWSASRPGRFTPEKEPLVPIGAPEPVLTWCRGEKFPAPGHPINVETLRWQEGGVEWIQLTQDKVQGGLS